MVRTFPVARGLKARGYEVWYYTVPDYEETVAHCADVDRVVLVPFKARRERDGAIDPVRWPYLAGEFDLTVDLYCPALRHEIETGGAVRRDRIELFCEAAGLPPETPEFAITPLEGAWAEGWFDAAGYAPQRTIALQPFSTTVMRDWRLARWQELIAALRARGLNVVAMDGNVGRLDQLECRRVEGLSVPKMAALLRRTALLIAVDSGLLHLAAAVGAACVGLFGSTDGRIICRHYPRAMPICAYEFPATAGAEALRCRPPCYMRLERGFQLVCGRRGCAVIERITVDRVLEAVGAFAGGNDQTRNSKLETRKRTSTAAI